LAKTKLVFTPLLYLSLKLSFVYFWKIISFCCGFGRKWLL